MLASCVLAVMLVHSPQARPRVASRPGGACMMSSPFVTRDAQEPLFRLWMRREGVRSDSLDLSTFGGRGRGCTALREIEAGELLVSLPVDAIIDLSALTQVPVPPTLVSPEVWLELPWYAQLATWVLAEKAKGSGGRWAAYIDLLPLEGRALDTPYHWPDAEIEALQYTWMVTSVYQQRLLFRQLHSAIVGSAPDSELTLAAFACACESVLSRAFPTGGLTAKAAEAAAAGSGGGLFGAFEGRKQPLLLPNAESHYALLPAVDSLNHRSGARGIFSYDARERIMELRTYDAVRAAGQVFLEYGQKGNDELLLMYGFVEANNPYEEVSCQGLESWLRTSHPPTRSLSADEWATRTARMEEAGLTGTLDSGTLNAKGAGDQLQMAATIACGSDASACAALASFCRAMIKEQPSRQDARAATPSAARAQTFATFLASKRATLKAADAALRKRADALKRKH
ncbi:hypothetical protein T492DRAFT_1082795 [Pavlovales sp. CCMP2436]|nr:hypothetical protein T492DRAFT_1082795 [Pavlovales sp. CCMP2436]